MKKEMESNGDDMEKTQQEVSIIGGADGPTSIFFAEDLEKTGLSEKIRNAHYEKKRNKVEKTITAKPHTLEEVVVYLQKEYGAVEMSKESDEYLEQHRCLKESLIIKHNPELLGDLAELESLTDYDEESLKKVWEQIELRSKRVATIPDEAFPMDFHIYAVKIAGAGEMQFCIDNLWNVLETSYNGTRRGMKKLRRISREVHLYYGVSKEDIENRSERYSSLIMELCTE